MMILMKSNLRLIFKMTKIWVLLMLLTLFLVVILWFNNSDQILDILMVPKELGLLRPLAMELMVAQCQTVQICN